MLQQDQGLDCKRDLTEKGFFFPVPYSSNNFIFFFLSDFLQIMKYLISRKTRSQKL